MKLRRTWVHCWRRNVSAPWEVLFFKSAIPVAEGYFARMWYDDWVDMYGILLSEGKIYSLKVKGVARQITKD